jgi:hypothetical protein
MIDIRNEELPIKVWVESELGLLGALEKREMWLAEAEYDHRTMTEVAIVKENALHHAKAHKIALEHVHRLNGIDMVKATECRGVMNEGGRGDGGATSYYELPEGATELRHLIKHKKMEHAIGEAFCALYRLNDNGEYKRNLEKVKFYIESELELCE